MGRPGRFTEHLSSDGKLILFIFRALQGQPGVSVAIPLKDGLVFPPLPQGGFQSVAEVAKLKAAIVIPHEFVDVGPALSFYIYLRQSVQ